MKNIAKVTVGLVIIQNFLINASVLADTIIVNGSEAKTELEKTTSIRKDDVKDDAEKHSSLTEETII